MLQNSNLEAIIIWLSQFSVHWFAWNFGDFSRTDFDYVFLKAQCWHSFQNRENHMIFRAVSWVFWYVQYTLICSPIDDQSATDGFGAKKAQVNFSKLWALLLQQQLTARQTESPQSPSLLFGGICEIISAQIRPSTNGHRRTGRLSAHELSQSTTMQSEKTALFSNTPLRENCHK